MNYFFLYGTETTFIKSSRWTKSEDWRIWQNLKPVFFHRRRTQSRVLMSVSRPIHGLLSHSMENWQNSKHLSQYKRNWDWFFPVSSVFSSDHSGSDSQPFYSWCFLWLSRNANPMLIVIKTLGNARPGPGGGREDDLKRPQLTFIDTAGPLATPISVLWWQADIGCGASRVVSSTSWMLKLQTTKKRCWVTSEGTAVVFKLLLATIAN